MTKRSCRTRIPRVTRPGNEDRSSGADDLLEVDFEPDHEKQKNQPQLGDGRDGFLAVDKSEARRADGKAADKVGENRRLAEKLRNHSKSPCRDDAQGDVVDELVHGRRNLERM